MAGQPLSLILQLDYTDGLCAPFALAARDLLGGEIQLLYATDPRHLSQQDWPIGMPLCLHAYLALADGRVVDAEGARSAEDMRRSFGVRRGWSYQVVPDPEVVELRREFRRTTSTSHVDAARQMLVAHAWDEGAPPATGELTRRFSEAREAQRERNRSKVEVAAISEIWNSISP